MISIYCMHAMLFVNMDKLYRIICDPFTQPGPVAQRIRRLTTDQKIPGSNPGRVVFFLFHPDGLTW